MPLLIVVRTSGLLCEPDKVDVATVSPVEASNTRGKLLTFACPLAPEWVGRQTKQPVDRPTDRQSDRAVRQSACLPAGGRASERSKLCPISKRNPTIEPLVHSIETSQGLFGLKISLLSDWLLFGGRLPNGLVTASRWPSEVKA